MWQPLPQVQCEWILWPCNSCILTKQMLRRIYLCLSKILRKNITRTASQKIDTGIVGRKEVTRSRKKKIGSPEIERYIYHANLLLESTKIETQQFQTFCPHDPTNLQSYLREDFYKSYWIEIGQLLN